MRHLFVASGLLLLPLAVHAVVASSSNYRLQADSINAAGVLSTSSSYRLEDTTGEAGTGVGTSSAYALNAGYQQMLESAIALSVPGTITLSPSIPDTGGAATGQGVWTVTTDNPAGYTMQIRAAGNPALQSGVNSFANYTPAGADPDFAFTIAAASAEFGYTPEGTDIVSRYRDNGAACNAGGSDTADRCWDALLTTDRLIAESAASNHPNGNATTVKFRAESGSSNVQPTGNYTATATVTVLAR